MYPKLISWIVENAFSAIESECCLSASASAECSISFDGYDRLQLAAHINQLVGLPRPDLHSIVISFFVLFFFLKWLFGKGGEAGWKTGR